MLSTEFELWDMHPTLTLYLTEKGRIQLDKIIVPEQVKVVQLPTCEINTGKRCKATKTASMPMPSRNWQRLII